ncbi:MAG: hypothetical protein LBM87_03465 [Ruminococcus sp.]|jgi:Tfp pilus assembly major pilin PilA|nr:hypothetical protein [Ruminococcus sp.]
MKKRALKGFTIVQMIICIAIIGILAAILVPSLSAYIKEAHITNSNAKAKQVYDVTKLFMQKAAQVNKMGAMLTYSTGSTFTTGSTAIARKTIFIVSPDELDMPFNDFKYVEMNRNASWNTVEMRREFIRFLAENFGDNPEMYNTAVMIDVDKYGNLVQVAWYGRRGGIDTTSTDILAQTGFDIKSYNQTKLDQGRYPIPFTVEEAMSAHDFVGPNYSLGYDIGKDFTADSVARGDDEPF